MGTGVGEAMLIGAAVGATAGGAGAAIQGGDPLKGALTGGAMGAVGGGLGAAAGAGGGAAAGAGSGSTAGAAGGASAGAGTGATTGSVFGGTAGTTGGATSLGTSIGGVSGGSGTLGSAGFGVAAPTGATVGSGMGSGAAGTGLTATSGLGASSGVYGAGAGAGTTAAGGYGIAAPTTAASMGGGAGSTAGAAGGSTAAGNNIFGYAPTDAGYLSNTQLGMTAGTAGLAGAMQAERGQYGQPDESYNGPLSKLKYDPNKFTASNPTYAPSSVYRPTYAAEGGIMQAYQTGGPVERMTQMNTAMNPQGGLYPQGMIDKTQYATPTQRPTSLEVVESEPSYDARVNPTTGTLMAKGGIARYDMGGIAGAASGLPNAGTSGGAQTMADQGIAGLGQLGKKRMLTKEQMDAIALQGMSKAGLQDVYGRMAEQGLAAGGISSLGSYSDGGRMLKGPGDGMSDNIPATIAGKQPARLADGEFVVPADVVSHLGNGSTDAGAKQLYAMMNRVRKARTGNPKQGKQIKPAKYLAA